MTLILILIVFIAVVVTVKNKIRIDIPSFVDKTLPLAMGQFGVYCFTGKQGSGKTYSLNKFIRKHQKNKVIYSNLTFTNLDYVHLSSVDELLSLSDKKDCVIIYDEIFTLMQKSSRLNGDMMEFLSQQRKQRNIFITTAQEWLELPISFRRFVRIQIECLTRPMGILGGILTERYYDAYNMKWDNMENEYIAPLITTKISKYQKRYMTTYDTFERIRKLK